MEPLTSIAVILVMIALIGFWIKWNSKIEENSERVSRPIGIKPQPPNPPPPQRRPLDNGIYKYNANIYGSVHDSLQHIETGEGMYYSTEETTTILSPFDDEMSRAKERIDVKGPQPSKPKIKQPSVAHRFDLEE